jgi:TPR repeat protein
MSDPVVGGAWSGAAATPAAGRSPQWGVPLNQQVRECEKRWSADCLKVATCELEPTQVSLVGISGRPHNAMLLYADMCFMGYGVQRDEEAARQWWARAAEEGNRTAAHRLRTGLYDSLLPGDETQV